MGENNQALYKMVLRKKYIPMHTALKNCGGAFNCGAWFQTQFKQDKLCPFRVLNNSCYTGACF